MIHNRLKAIILLFIATFSVMGGVEKSPYLLYEGSNIKMTVLWQMTSRESCTIKWGETKSYELGSSATTEYGSDNQHKFTIDNLTPNTLYYYNVEGVGGGKFRTAPEENESSIKVFAYGDTRSNPSDHRRVADAIMNRIKSDSQRHSAIFFSGDYVSQGGSERDWNEHFFSPAEKLLNDIPNIGSIGNHEERDQGRLLRKYYPFPYETSRGFYWSCDYGPLHVVFVDQYRSGGHNGYTQGTAQYNFIKADLAASDKEWKMVVFHEPGWSASASGYSANPLSRGSKNIRQVQNDLQPLFVEHGVDLVIGGDNHYYSRAVVEGVNHVTTGGGGAPLYSPNPSSPYIVKTDKSNHFCEIDIDGANLKFTARRSSGSIIESFDIAHETESPTVSLISPSKDTLIQLDETAVIKATVNPVGGTVQSVDFYVDGVSIAGGETKPYQAQFSSATEGTFEVCVNATIDGTTYKGDTITIEVVDPANHEFTITVPVAGSSDDAEEDIGGSTDGEVRTDSPDLDILTDVYQNTDYQQCVGVRFESLDIPTSVNITSAVIEFTASEATSGSADITIAGEATGNSVTFNAGASKGISSRTKTSSVVQWSPSSWTAANKYSTADLTDIVNEIVSRNSWSSGNPITFVFDGNGKRVAHSFDGGTAPQLIIKYKTGGSSETIVVDTIHTISLDTIIAIDSVTMSTKDTLVTTDSIEVSIDSVTEKSDTIVNGLSSGVGYELLKVTKDSTIFSTFLDTLKWGETGIAEDIANATKVIPIVPNPIIKSETSTIRFAIPQGIGQYELKIFDPVGNIMWNSTGDLYETVLEWNGFTNYGRKINGGSYLVLLYVTYLDGTVEIQKSMLGVKE